ncbi:MAG TPA: gamma-glutamyltransferase [Allosphingosinicella sp.]|nr:gamma-glutamyltransferase [Allosphingosinicella sp.]
MFSRLFLPLLLVLASCATAPDPAPANEARSGGMVSAADPRAAEAGRWILNQGGNAADAAIAVQIALTVVEPQSSGIGGGGFFVYHDAAKNRVFTYDGREKAPDAASPTWFFGPDGKPLPYRQAIPGGRSVGVPGNIRLMALAHSRHGRLPWAKLFEPAIRLARDGFALTPRGRNAIANSRDLAGMSAWGRGQLFGPDGEPKAVGTVMRNPELAQFLERLARRGPDYFYVGPAAEALVRTVNGAARNPSAMVAGDLAAYEAKERPPVCALYRRYRICGMGPPSSGATTVYATLKQLERFDLRGLGKDNPVAWHLIGNSMRLAFADRDAYLADPDFVAVPVAGLMDPAYLASRSKLISADRAIEKAVAGAPPGAPRVTAATAMEVPSTSHMSTADGAGNVASVTSTIEGGWGSGLTVNGMFLNNELTDFSIAPQIDGAPVANRVEGGKRPRSSMAPTIVYGPDGKVRLAVGAAGGPTIIAQVAKAIIAVIDWDLSAQEAIALPTIFAPGDGLMVERGTSLEAMIPALQALGNKAAPMNPGFKANAVERVNGGWRGGADPRSEGVALAQ